MIGYVGKLTRMYSNIVELNETQLCDLSTDFDLVLIENDSVKSLNIRIPVIYILSSKKEMFPYPYLVKTEVNVELILELVDKGNLDAIYEHTYKQFEKILSLSNINTLNSLKIFVYEALRQQNVLSNMANEFLAKFNGEMEKLLDVNRDLANQVLRLEELNTKLTSEIDSLKSEIKDTVNTSVKEGIAIIGPTISNNLQLVDTFTFTKQQKNPVFLF